MNVKQEKWEKRIKERPGDGCPWKKGEIWGWSTDLGNMVFRSVEEGWDKGGRGHGIKEWGQRSEDEWDNGSDEGVWGARKRKCNSSRMMHRVSGWIPGWNREHRTKPGVKQIHSRYHKEKYWALLRERELIARLFFLVFIFSFYICFSLKVVQLSIVQSS